MMTEEQAIERIAQTICCTSIFDEHDASALAHHVWNEIKAIAREDRHMFGPVPAWRDDMTIEEAKRELLRGMKAEGQNMVRNPAWP